MSLDDKVKNEILEIANKYSMPDDLAQLKFKEIKDHVKVIHPNRSDAFYLNVSLIRLRNYAKAYLDNNGWEHYS